jgi:hypothetical protein
LAAVRNRDRAARRFPLLAAVSAFARFVRDVICRGTAGIPVARMLAMRVCVPCDRVVTAGRRRREPWKTARVAGIVCARFARDVICRGTVGIPVSRMFAMRVFAR